MPLTVALHCSMVKKPQFVPPPPVFEYWAHHRVLSQGRAVAGVCVSTAGTTTSAAITLVPKLIQASTGRYLNNSANKKSPSPRPPEKPKYLSKKTTDFVPKKTPRNRGGRRYGPKFNPQVHG